MPTTPTALVTSHSGLTLTFNGITGLITKTNELESSFTDPVEDVSDLSLDDGDLRVIEPKPQLGPEEVKFQAQYVASRTYPKVNDEGALSCSLGTISGHAVCTQATVVYQTGEYVTLDLAFRVGASPD